MHSPRGCKHSTTPTQGHTPCGHPMPQQRGAGPTNACSCTGMARRDVTAPMWGTPWRVRSWRRFQKHRSMVALFARTMHLHRCVVHHIGYGARGVAAEAWCATHLHRCVVHHKGRGRLQPRQQLQDKGARVPVGGRHYETVKREKGGAGRLNTGRRGQRREKGGRSAAAAGGGNSV